MSKLQVLVFDDSLNVAKGLADKVRAVYDADVTAVELETFRELIEKVNQRRDKWRGEEGDFTPVEPIEVDDADVVIVDYDLLRYSETGDITGSRLAYLLRCFTKCGLIVVLNEFGTNTFDTSLRNPTLDFADLHLGAVQIGNPGLWTDSFEGYRPWHWPVLPNARENLEKCVEDVRQNLNTPVLDFLGLERFIDWLPKIAQDFFLDSGNMEAVRFDTFVKQSRGGIELKDDLPPEFMARVAAARLLVLLNGLILPEQSILVDAPHLVSRFPSLLRDESQDIHSWNRLCNPVNEGITELLADVLTEYRFKRQHWLWRPVWYWPDLNRDAGIDEVQNPWDVKDVEWVFCENLSRFVLAEFADDFRADVSPPFNKRYVFKRDTPEARRYLDQVDTDGPQDPLTVDYVPQVAFSV